MKRLIGSIVCTCVLCLLLLVPASSQNKLLSPDLILKSHTHSEMPAQPVLESPLRYKIPGKSISQYTVEDWGKLVDSTWGPGQTGAEQLNIFDVFWDSVNTRSAGFPNLALNWDSVRNVYRPQIGSGLSRGKFYALMSRMSLALTEMHTFLIDYKVDTSYGTNFRYKRGIPLLLTGCWNPRFAGVTPMPDSSSLVYRIDPGNPLGLVPGDLILGYNGKPWKSWYKLLIDAGVPVDWYYSWLGSTPEAMTYALLSGAAANWGMFDTIDVVKYSTGDTLHLPTAPLETFAQTVWASDQVPIAGVRLPDSPNPVMGASVTWDIIQGTNIGYIYVWDLISGVSESQVQTAVLDLCWTKKVEGLIIDFRMNWGGDPSYGNAGLSQLFNFDPSPNLLLARRNNPSDHLGFSVGEVPASYWLRNWALTPRMTPYDRPIAVLIGPGCFSAAEYNAFRMRFHPMARLFGKPTSGAFVGGDSSSGHFSDAWYYRVPTSIAYSALPGEGYLIHKGVQPDEQVWLTRDGVAKGEDAVVNRALAWITSLSYAHDVKTDKVVVKKTGDSVAVTAKVENPNNHVLAISAIMGDAAGAPADSVALWNDGKHGDGAAGDSIWGATLKTSASEGFFGVTVRTDDQTQGTYRRLLNAAYVISAGPIVVDSYTITTADTIAGPGKTLRYRITLKNLGSTVTVKNVTAKVSSLDTTVTIPNTVLSYGDIAPGQTSSGTGLQGIRYAASRPGNYVVQFSVAISTNGMLVWNGTFADLVTGVEEPGESLPKVFALEQNYPNPFNPTTKIQFSIVNRQLTIVKVFDVLGREAATLVNEVKEPGDYTVQFDASGLPSGVYFYRLHAGDFVAVKKMLLVR